MRKNLVKFFIGIFLGGFLTYFINFSQIKLENFLTAQITKPLEEINFVKIERPKKPPLELDVKAALSIRLNPQKKIKERVLFSKNENEILPIASLTKLMTALVVIENQENYPFKEQIKISKEAALQEDVPEYGNLKAGEKKKIEELLNLMLVFSSNDAAYALAEQIGVENFVNRMNEKAKEIGLKSTHFSNPTGLDPENLKWNLENKDYFNYSTAKDLILLGKYILENYPLIFEFSNQKNKIQLLENQHLVGMKTGYTDEAGGCIFLIFSNDNGDYFLNVILGAKSKEERFLQMQKLIDWINGKI
jgi:D-alanyl-D-alanine carboxypeptidase (penicillin-binding protein 5/6)